MKVGTSGFWPRPERSSDFVFDGRLYALKVNRYCHRIGRCQMRRFSHGMMGASVRPDGIFPVVIAVTISFVLHCPMPVSLSGVKFGALNTPSPVIEKPISDPARNLSVCS